MIKINRIEDDYLNTMNDIKQIKKIIENALADGRLSAQESEMIKRAIYQDKRVTKEEAALWRELQVQVAKGEILID